MTRARSCKIKRTGADLLGGRAESVSMRPFSPSELRGAFSLPDAQQNSLLRAIGLHGAATKAALRGIETEPRSENSWLVLLETLLAAGKGGHAIKVASVFSLLFPNSHLPAYMAARAHISLGRLSEGRKLLLVSLGKNNGFTPAYMELFGLASARQNFKELVFLAGRALRECPASECGQLMSLAGKILFSDEPSPARLAAAAELPLLLAAPIRERVLRFPPHFLGDNAVFLARGGRLRAAERASSLFLAAAGPGTPPSEDTFKAKCRLDRYSEAFREAEELLSSGQMGAIALWNPWFGIRIVPKTYWKKRLAALTVTIVPECLTHWKSFYGFILKRKAEEDLPSPDFGGLPMKYAWMNFYFAEEMLSRCEMRGALAVLSRAAASIPGDPYLLCRYAEALICAGRKREGFRVFDSVIRAGKWAHESAAWKGQMLLMTGDYQGAGRLLSGRRSAYSEGWLGAIRYLTGRRTEALRLLEGVERRNGRSDMESELWLAELYRKIGRSVKAKRILDRLIRNEPSYHLARVNRALLNAALGKGICVLRDLGKIDPELLRAAVSACGMRAVPGEITGGLKEVLCKILELAKGNRRPERHFLKIGFPGVSEG